jgi:DNA-binding MarR family transcriptional regulator
VRKKLSEGQLAAWKSLLNAHARATSEIEMGLKAGGKIALTWYDILWALRKGGGDCCLRFRALQDEIVLSRSALSRSVDALAQAGFVTKRPCKADQRGLDVQLTESGKKALADARPIYSEGIARHFAHYLTDEECARLAEILGKVAAARAN